MAPLPRPPCCRVSKCPVIWSGNHNLAWRGRTGGSALTKSARARKPSNFRPGARRDSLERRELNFRRRSRQDFSFTRSERGNFLQTSKPAKCRLNYRITLGASNYFIFKLKQFVLSCFPNRIDHINQAPNMESFKLDESRAGTRDSTFEAST